MDGRELAVRLARKRKVPRGAAADQVDEVVRDILARLRSGQPAALPGLGTLFPDAAGIRFEPETRPHPAGRGRE